MRGTSPTRSSFPGTHGPTHIRPHRLYSPLLHPFNRDKQRGARVAVNGYYTTNHNRAGRDRAAGPSTPAPAPAKHSTTRHASTPSSCGEYGSLGPGRAPLDSHQEEPTHNNSRVIQNKSLCSILACINVSYTRDTSTGALRTRSRGSGGYIGELRVVILYICKNARQGSGVQRGSRKRCSVLFWNGYQE